MKIYEPLMFNNDPFNKEDCVISDFFCHTNRNGNPTQVVAAVFEMWYIKTFFVHETTPNKLMIANDDRLTIYDITQIQYLTYYDLSNFANFGGAKKFQIDNPNVSTKNFVLDNIRCAARDCDEDLTNLTEMITLYTL